MVFALKQMVDGLTPYVCIYIYIYIIYIYIIYIFIIYIYIYIYICDFIVGLAKRLVCIIRKIEADIKVKLMKLTIFTLIL